MEHLGLCGHRGFAPGKFAWRLDTAIFASKTEKVSLTYPSTTIVETAGLAVPDVSRELFFPSMCSLTNHAGKTAELSENTPRAPKKLFYKKFLPRFFQKSGHGSNAWALVALRRERNTPRRNTPRRNTPRRNPPIKSNRLRQAREPQRRRRA